MKWILLIEDDIDQVEFMTDVLMDEGHMVCLAQTFEDAAFALETGDMDFVICDWDLGPNEPLKGDEIVTGLRRVAPELHYIIHSGLDRPVADSVDFFTKDRIDKIVDLINAS